MIALSTLSMINKNLLETQGQISTGKTVDNSSQNAAIWAVTTVMEADVDGFNAISESLSLGKATVSVARNASEKITELLRDVKTKVVAANGENIDRAKVQTDIDELTNQISSIVSAAQFNGLNLIDGSSTTAISVVSSLDRSATSVTSSNISVARQDLSVTGDTFGTTGATNAVLAGGGTLDTANDTISFAISAADTSGQGTYTFDFNGGNAVAVTVDADQTDESAALKIAEAINDAAINGVTADVNAGTLIIENTNSFSSFNVNATATGNNAQVAGAATATDTIDASSDSLTLNARAIAAGDSYRVTLTKDVNADGTDDNVNFDYVAKDGDTINDVAEGIKALVEADSDFSEVSMFVDESGNPTVDDARLLFDVSTGSVGIARAESTGGTRGGGLAALAAIDVTSNASAAAALTAVEDLIQTSIDAAAAFGSSEGRLKIQEEFVDSLVTSMEQGVGALVDTDMEAASARLQALQVQQQLGTQALSIANSAPQSILSLFR